MLSIQADYLLTPKPLVSNSEIIVDTITSISNTPRPIITSPKPVIVNTAKPSSLVSKQTGSYPPKRISKRSKHLKKKTYYIFPPKHSYPDYSFADNYYEQPQKQLVLFTTVEVKKGKKPDYDVVNHLKMYSFFQQQYNFTGIVFSGSPEIINLCNEYHITVVKEYKTNKYHVPLIRDLYQQAYHLVRSRFYGYINSDIIMSVGIFNYLTITEDRINNHLIPENVELAGRVFETTTKATADISSESGYNRFVKSLKRDFLRNKNSADFFIFPNSFDFAVLEDAVIGRERIDNYLLMMMSKFTGYLIDISFRVPSYHFGRSGYINKQHGQSRENRNWNLRYVHDIMEQRASLQFAKVRA